MPSPYIDSQFPLVELHRHLDGNVRLSTILEIGLKYNLGLPADTIEGLRPYVQVVEPKPSILDFFQKFEWLTKAMVNYDACYRIAYENVDACWQALRELGADRIGHTLTDPALLR
jgi:adenosine deaminase